MTQATDIADLKKRMTALEGRVTVLEKPVPTPPPPPPPPPSPPPPPAPPPSAFTLGLHVTGALYWWEVHNHYFPAIPIKAVRIWDVWMSAATGGMTGVSWGNVHTGPGVFNWERLDSYIALMNTKGVTDIIYACGKTPKWARADGNTTKAPDKLEIWDEFLRALMTRYKGKIQAYSVWNEPSAPNFWTDTIPKLAEMGGRMKVIRDQIDPAAKIISPETNGNNATWMKTYIAAPGGRDWDILGIHPYGKGLAAWKTIITNYKNVVAAAGITGRPIWMTESGFYAPYGTLGTAPDWMKMSVDLCTAEGIARYYWYAYDADVGKMITTQYPPANGSPAVENETAAAYRALIR